MDYSACVDEYRASKRENRVRPLKCKLKNISDYDTIYLGSPIWSGTIVLPVKYFLPNTTFPENGLSRSLHMVAVVLRVVLQI